MLPGPRPPSSFLSCFLQLNTCPYPLAFTSAPGVGLSIPKNPTQLLAKAVLASTRRNGIIAGTASTSSPQLSPTLYRRAQNLRVDSGFAKRLSFVIFLVVLPLSSSSLPSVRRTCRSPAVVIPAAAAVVFELPELARLIYSIIYISVIITFELYCIGFALSPFFVLIPEYAHQGTGEPAPSFP
jgi:hypothetical protein